MKSLLKLPATQTSISIAAVLTLGIVSSRGFAQSTTGSIVGTLTDSTGAVVPGATVTITNLGTNDKRTQTADKDGTYRILNLPPGQYREDIDLTGFKHFTRSPVEVDVAGTVRLDVPMEVGGSNETVTVTSETPLLQADSGSLSQVIGPKTVQEMPLNGRNVTNLVALVPGVVPQAATAGATASNAGGGHTNNAGFNNYQIGGGLAGESTSYLDGAPINGLGYNVAVLVPTQDAVGEFRVVTSAASAEYGRFGGGVVNYSTKSGSNDLHGSVYEYFRNKVLNTSTYFQKLNSLPKAAYQQNQYGGTLGGHLIKNKTFFFLSYEGYKSAIGTTVITTVPTAAERAGDFSGDLTSTSNCTATNPTAAQLQGCVFNPYTSVVSASGAVTRTPFANNKIPSSMFDPTANIIMNVLQYYPLPTKTAATNNYASTPVPGGTARQGTARIDENLSDRQHLFGRYTYWTLNDTPQNVFGNLTSGAGADIETNQAVLGDTYSISPALTFDVRLSFTRGYSDDNPPSLGRNLGDFGPSWATLQNQVSFPLNITTNVSGLYAFNGMQQIDREYRNTSDIAPSLSWLKGQHSFKFGADLRYLDFNYFTANGTSGFFTFTPGFTTYNNSASGATDNSIASFLLGAPNTGNIYTVHSPAQYSKYQGYYVNDTWQATRKLTLNMGLRWELPGAFFEKHDLATVLLPNGASSLGGNYKGSLAFVNSSAWNSRATGQIRYTDFSPRLGLSYSPTEKTVVRAAYALIYLPFDTYAGAMPFLSPINQATTTIVNSVNNANIVPYNTLSDPFPTGGTKGVVQQSILQPSGRSQAYLNGLNGLSITGAIPTVRLPYSQQWTTSVQQELSGGTLFQLAYAGNRGTFLPEGVSNSNGSVNNLNQLPDQYDSLGTAALTKSVANPLAGQVSTLGSLNGTNTTAGQLLRPYPQYTNVIQTNATGDSIYHSLQASLEKRFQGGGVLLSNYTWAKVIGNVAGSGISENGLTVGALQDFTNPRGDRSVLNFDVRHRFVSSFVSPLPFGHGKKYLSNLSGVLGGLVSGWEGNGIVTFQTGFGISLLSQPNTLQTSFGAGVIRPNVVPGCTAQLKGPAQARLSGWFNKACFTAPSDTGFGNEPRVDTSLRTSGIANYDGSLAKTTNLTEHVSLQLRAEVFNIFNRVQFGPPAATYGASNFGTVTTQINNPRLIQLSGRINF